jgi:hypothetical protein
MNENLDPKDTQWVKSHLWGAVAEQPLPMPDAGAVQARAKRSRRNHLLGGAGAVVALTAGVIMVTSWWPTPSILAVPQPVAAPTTSAAAESTAPETAVPTPAFKPPSINQAELSVLSTEGWQTYQSKDIPVTLKYPADWRIETDECDRTGQCWVGLAPKDMWDELSHLLLTRSSTDVSASEWYDDPHQLRDTSWVDSLPELKKAEWEQAVLAGELDENGLEVIGSLPGLLAWGSPSDDAPSPILVAKKEDPCGNDLESLCTQYSLITADPTASASGYMESLAMDDGSGNPFLKSGAFTFRLEWQNTSRSDMDDDTVLSVLASLRVNPGFEAPGPAEEVVWVNEGLVTMDAVQPDSGWKDVDLEGIGLTAKVPAKQITTTELDYGWVMRTQGKGEPQPGDGALELTILRNNDETWIEYARPNVDLGVIPDLTDVDGRPVHIGLEASTGSISVRLYVEDPNAAEGWNPYPDFGEGRVEIAAVWDPSSVAEVNQVVAILAGLHR